MNIALWIIQVLLALLFLFAGAMKLIMPIEEMTKQMPLAIPGLFLRFIGVVEVLGGLGLILPMLLRIKPWLTPLAAAGLVILMIGAVAFSLMIGVTGNPRAGYGTTRGVCCARSLATGSADCALRSWGLISYGHDRSRKLFNSSCGDGTGTQRR